MVDCNKVKTYCDCCIHNPTLVDHYIEVNELNSLFKDAPIIYEYVNRSHIPPSVRIVPIQESYHQVLVPRLSGYLH